MFGFDKIFVSNDYDTRYGMNIACINVNGFASNKNKRFCSIIFLFKTFKTTNNLLFLTNTMKIKRELFEASLSLLPISTAQTLVNIFFLVNINTIL